jgi:predicted site-specific integrase-resolvase
MKRTSSPFDNIRLIKFAETCEVLDISPWTLKEWIKKGLFPPPLYLTPTSPGTFRVRDIAHHLEKRRRGRRVKQQPRGALKRKEASK